MVFRATRKLVRWYSEQQVNSFYGILSNKEIHAKGNSSNKEIHAPVSCPNIFEIWDLSKTSQPNFKKKCFFNKRTDWEHILLIMFVPQCHMRMSHIMCHVSCVTCNFSTEGGGSVINGAYPVKF